MMNKRRGQEEFAAVKLDMSKAYDRVEWLFLAQMMEKMGFHERWIDRVMTCVSSVTYRIFKANGVLTDPFAPERGLRQGDPLSPYLFLLCAEGFSALLQKAEEDGQIKGVKVCSRAHACHTCYLRITHCCCSGQTGVMQKKCRTFYTSMSFAQAR